MKNVSDVKKMLLLLAGIGLLFSNIATADLNQSSLSQSPFSTNSVSQSERLGKAQSLFYYARALFNQERFAEAAPHLKTVLALNPQHRYAGRLLIASKELQSMQDAEKRRLAKLRVMIDMVSAAVKDLDASFMVLSRR